MTDPARLAALEDALGRIERLSTPAQTGGLSEVSFGLRDDLLARLESLFDRLLKAVSHYAWAETEFATTVVSYNGGMSTAWAGAPGRKPAEVHLASLDGALQFRAKLFRVLIVSLQAVVSISLTAVAPASALMALNSAWKLVGELQGILDLVPTAPQ